MRSLTIFSISIFSSFPLVLSLVPSSCPASSRGETCLLPLPHCHQSQLDAKSLEAPSVSSVHLYRSTAIALIHYCPPWVWMTTVGSKSVPLASNFLLFQSVLYTVTKVILNISQIRVILACYCCWNKLPQTEWLKNNTDYISGGHKSWSQRCQQGCVHSGHSRGEPVVLLFSASRDHLHSIPWFMAPPFILKASSTASLNIWHWLSCLPLIRSLRITFGPLSQSRTLMPSEDPKSHLWSPFCHIK